VFEAECAAGDLVYDRQVAGAVVGHHLLDVDAVGGEVSDCNGKFGDGDS
jgi:hypothetical protein